MSVLYMLDTDTCAFILRKSSPVLLNRIQQVPLVQQCVSVVTFAELLYGLQVASKKKTNQIAFDEMMRHLAVLDWNPEAARHYADIRHTLQKTGRQLGANDLFIAAHARSLGATVVTNNVKDFARVRGLKVENWTI